MVSELSKCFEPTRLVTAQRTNRFEFKVTIECCLQIFELLPESSHPGTAAAVPACRGQQPVVVTQKFDESSAYLYTSLQVFDILHGIRSQVGTRQSFGHRPERRPIDLALKLPDPGQSGVPKICRNLFSAPGSMAPANLFLGPVSQRDG